MKRKYNQDLDRVIPKYVVMLKRRTYTVNEPKLHSQILVCLDHSNSLIPAKNIKIGMTNFAMMTTFIILQLTLVGSMFNMYVH